MQFIRRKERAIWIARGKWSIDLWEGWGDDQRSDGWSCCQTTLHASFLPPNNFWTRKKQSEQLHPETARCSLRRILHRCLPQLIIRMLWYTTLYLGTCKEFASQAFDTGAKLFMALHKPYCNTNFAEEEDWCLDNKIESWVSMYNCGYFASELGEYV